MGKRQQKMERRKQRLAELKSIEMKKKPNFAVVKWLRAAGGVALLFGLGGLLLADRFWVGVSGIYLGFALLMLDVWFEPDFQRKWKIKGLMWVAILIVALIFSWSVVFVQGPLPVFAMVTDGEYPAGTSIAGIEWKPQFTEVTVDVENPTDKAYGDLNLVIRPTEAVAAIAQSSGVSDVSFEDKNGFNTRVLDYNLTTGTSKTVPLALLATDAGYRLRCGHLSGHTHLRIVMAVAVLKWNPSEPSGAPVDLEQVVRDKNYVMKVKFDDFSSYWIGHKDGDVYAPRPSVDWLKIEGDYIVGYRRISISQRVTVAGKLTIKRQ